MKIVPSTITAARQFVDLHHRHNAPPKGGLFAVGLAEEGETIGVAIIGRPVSRYLDDKMTCEITRLCTLGHKNACSMLYGAASRAAKALGYRRIITYTLQREPGSSLKASGWILSGEVKAAVWSRPGRPRTIVATDLFESNSGRTLKYQPEAKYRWEKQLHPPQ